MVSFSDAIRIAINADGTKAVSEFKKVGAAAEQNLKKADGSGKNLSKTLTHIGIGAIGVGATLGAGLFKAAEAASRAQLEHDKLNNTIKNSPALAGASIAAFNKQQKAIEGTTVADDEAVAGLQAVLGQFKLNQAQILQVTPLVVDLSRKMGIDLPTAAKAVGKAIDGNGGSLARFGIKVAVTKDGTNNLALVVDKLRGTVGGFATTEGKSFTGQLEIAKNKLRDTEEAIGQGAIPVITQLAGVAQNAAKGFLFLNDATGGKVGQFAAYGAAALIVGGSISFVAGQAKNLATGAIAAAEKLGILAAAEGEAGAASLTTGGAITLGLAAAAVPVIGIISSLAHRNDDLKKTAEETAKALEHEGKSLGNIARGQAADFLSKHQSIDDALHKSGLSAEDFAKALAGNKDAMDLVIAAMAKAGNIGPHTATAFFRLAEGNKMGAEEAKRYAAAQGELGKATKESGDASAAALKDRPGLFARATVAASHYADAEKKVHYSVSSSPILGGKYAIDIKALGAAFLSTTGQIHRTARAGGEFAINFDDVAKATLAVGTASSETSIDVGHVTYNISKEAKAAKDAANHLYDVVGATNALHRAQRDLRGSVLDFGDAEVAVLGAQKDLNDAIKQYGPNSVQARIASEALQRAQIDAGNSLDDMRQKALDAAKAVAGGSTSSHKYKAALENLKNQFPALAAWLDVVIGKLNQFASFHNATVTVNGQPIGLLSTSGEFKGNGSNGKVIKKEGGWVPGAKDQPVDAILHGGEFVVSNEMLAGRKAIPSGIRGGGKASGGGTVTHIYNITSNDPKTIVDTLRKYNRDYGALPVKVA